MESKHQVPNVYIIKPLNGKGPMCMVKWWQLFDLHKSEGNDMPSSPAPDTKLPTMLMKKPTKNVTPQQSHPYGTRSKTKANSIALQSTSEDETKEDSIVLESSSEDGRSFGASEICLTTSQPNFGSKGVTGTNIYSSILRANNPFYCYVIPIYTVTVGSFVVPACWGLASEDWCSRVIAGLFKC